MDATPTIAGDPRFIAGKLAVGDTVCARFQGGEDWFGGRITRLRDDLTFDIAYSDGDTEDRVPLAHIRHMTSDGRPLTLGEASEAVQGEAVVRLQAAQRGARGRKRARARQAQGRASARGLAVETSPSRGELKGEEAADDVVTPRSRPQMARASALGVRHEVEQARQLANPNRS